MEHSVANLSRVFFFFFLPPTFHSCEEGVNSSLKILPSSTESVCFGRIAMPASGDKYQVGQFLVLWQVEKHFSISYPDHWVITTT